MTDIAKIHDEVSELMQRPGVADVLRERLEQVTVHGYTSDHDSEHMAVELMCAGDAYGVVAGMQLSGMNTSEAVLEGISQWPWDERAFKPSGDVRANLVKAIALQLAALDRLDATAPDAPIAEKI